MLKYVSKFALDILPSVVATIIGAYIVNHYIVAKPADAPAAAAVSTSDPAKADPKALESVATIPEAGVKAKGISERAILEKTATEKPAVVDKLADTAGPPAEMRRHQPGLREKAVAKAVQTPAPAPAPAAAPPGPPVEAIVAPEEKRDANDLARAAIERLRGTNDASPPRVQEAVRIPEAPSRAPEAPHVASAPAVQPLPPPIMVSAPNTEALNPATSSVPTKPPYGTARIDDPRRPTPPADIPSSSPPVDLRAEAALPPPRERTSVADDVLSAAKSVFHAVLPR
ncbi:MAG TPA: hypothetical protein VGO01_01945 [Bradyrhizobium sp.]|jgi:hypothetical protein|nr:hypothetical protein [Bradyrhizobium sp.]